ncbi:MAG: sigma-70 family RNA polymerase sigma factor [Candidatus Aminicenantes bacterium]|nr:sigma-70 family RNA polymerase sigma factor [Candidatus Aminicenantes bacterium]
MDEQELISRVRGGDEAAFARIVGLYKDRIVNYIYHLTGDYEKAVDLSQETFMRVFFKADKYRPVAALSCWIYTIAGNLAKTELKKRRRALVVPLEEVQNDLQSGSYSEDAPDTGLTRNLRTALDDLNPRYRIPVVLKDVEGYSQEEIAAILKKPVGTIKARISRGRHMLRRALERSVSGARELALAKEFENGRV